LNVKRVSTPANFFARRRQSRRRQRYRSGGGLESVFYRHPHVTALLANDRARQDHSSPTHHVDAWRTTEFRILTPPTDEQTPQ
jgi:hypothetical protein